MMIREAHEEDIESLMILLQECDLMPKNENLFFKPLIIEKINKDPDLFLVAFDEKDSSIIGCIVGLYDPLCSYMRLLAVTSLSRKKGVATALRTAMIKALRKRGTVFIGALMYVSNKPIYNLNKKMGWVQLEDCHCFYIDLRDKQLCKTMEENVHRA